MSDPIPTAETRSRRVWSWLWLLPVAALCGSVWLFYSAYSQHGIPLELHFQHGYGLKAGDALRYRGIDIGRVDEVNLAPDLEGITVKLHVWHSAREVAREGSRFWIVRPQLDLSGAAGLETLVGAKYLGVLPGSGKPTKRFNGLETPPLLELMPPGGVRVVLNTSGQGSLRRGAPVMYRQVTIGILLSVELAQNAAGVEAHAYINPAYKHLIRAKTKFWKADGAKFSAGWLSGLSVKIDSVQTLLSGGVAIAVPAQAGAQAEDGQHFSLHDEAQEEWLEWTPSLPRFGTLTEQWRPLALTAELKWTYENYLQRCVGTKVVPITG